MKINTITFIFLLSMLFVSSANAETCVDENGNLDVPCLCGILCKIGEGGSLCNCDIPPF
jgi:hypothetical protein